MHWAEKQTITTARIAPAERRALIALSPFRTFVVKFPKWDEGCAGGEDQRWSEWPLPLTALQPAGSRVSLCAGKHACIPLFISRQHEHAGL